MIHELKILPEHFWPVVAGVKLAELRKNDRGYQVNDYLKLCEWTDDKGFTKKIAVRKIIHVADVGSYLPGFVLLSLEMI